MADAGEKKGVSRHSRPPTPDEVAAFQAVHYSTDRVVLAPILLNGEERFALALVCTKPEDGQVYLKILAYLPLPTDTLLDRHGLPGYQKTPPSSQDLN